MGKRLSVESFSPHDAERFRGEFRRIVRADLLLRVYYMDLAARLVPLYFLLAVASGLTYPWIAPGLTVGGRFCALMAACIGSPLCLGAVVASNALLKRWFPLRRPESSDGTLLVTLAFVAVGLLLPFALLPEASFPTPQLLLSATLPSVVLLGTLCLGSIAVSVTYAKARVSRYPLMHCAVLAVRAVQEIGNHSINVGDGPRYQVRSLRRVANGLMAGLTNMAKWQGRKQAEIVRLRVSGASEAVAEYGMWLCLAQRDTDDAVLYEVSRLIRTLSIGRLDDLPAPGGDIDVGAVVSAPTRLLRGLRTVVVGALPLAALQLLRWVGLVPEGAIGDAVLGLSIVWLAVVYMGALDPGFSQRLATLKDVAGLVKDIAK